MESEHEQVLCGRCGWALCGTCGCCCNEGCEMCSCPDVEKEGREEGES